MSDIYCQLIPNEDDNDPYYQVMPRMGAFEVSVNGCVSNQQIYLLRIENALPVSQFKLRVQKRTIFFLLCFWTWLFNLGIYHLAGIFEMSVWIVAPFPSHGRAMCHSCWADMEESWRRSDRFPNNWKSKGSKTKRKASWGYKDAPPYAAKRCKASSCKRGSSCLRSSKGRTTSYCWSTNGARRAKGRTKASIKRRSWSSKSRGSQAGWACSSLSSSCRSRASWSS